MAETKGLETNTIHAFVTRRPLGPDSSGLAVTLLGQTAFLASDGFHGPLAFWDGRFLNVPATQFGQKHQRGRSSLYEAGGDIARLLLREAVTHVHGTAQWEAIEPVAPVFSAGTRITWTAKNGDALIRLPYPFIFDAKNLVIIAPDVQTAFLRARRHEEAYLRILRTLGGTIAPTKREEIARKVSSLRTRSERERDKRIVLSEGRNP
ncbi:MAG: hypothetical protein ABSH25_13530 [Syntrophorhabdales bacterium]|jgi:hypothetical protein